MNTEIADIAMQMAFDSGCHDLKVVLLQNHECTIQVHNGDIERMQQSTATSMALNLFINGRDGFFYTNKLKEEDLLSFIKQAVETTQILEPDECRTLADPSRYYKGHGPDLKNCDHTLPLIHPEKKIELALQNNRSLEKADKRIISTESRYSDRKHQAYYLISNGFKGKEESSRCTLSTIVTVEGKDGQHPMDGWGNTRIFFHDLHDDGIAQIALERTLRKIGQRPAPSGTYQMIVESPVAGHLLQPMLNALCGQSLQQRTSFLYGKQDQQVGSTLLPLIDNPLIPGTCGACHFDYDGVATEYRTIFDKGILRTYFIDTPYSNKLKMPATTQGTHHLILTPGTQSLQQLIKSSENAIMVTDFNGGNCDPANGRFSYGIEGFLIKNGVITQPVSGMNITGDMDSLWQSLVAVANDADPWETELIPSLLFNEISFGGM